MPYTGCSQRPCRIRRPLMNAVPTQGGDDVFDDVRPGLSLLTDRVTQRRPVPLGFVFDLIVVVLTDICRFATGYVIIMESGRDCVEVQATIFSRSLYRSCRVHGPVRWELGT